MKLLSAIAAIVIILPVILVTLALWMNQASLVGEPGAMRRLALYLGTNVAETGPRPVLPELATPVLSLPADQVITALRDAIGALGWTLATSDRAARRLQAVVTTPLFRFRDDISIEVQALGTDRTSLYLRSASRVGRGDLGANRRHILQLLDRLRTGLRMSATGGGRVIRCVVLGLLGSVFLSGCGTVGYYLQAAHGQFSLLEAARPIDEWLDDGDLPAAQADRLRTVLAMRRFAVDELDLPDNASYTSYARLDRDAVLWSVVAAPEFSLQPRTWCFPVIGCAAYRGYFHRDAAEQLAAQLRNEGDDVLVVAVPAYSTLGWFDDPLPSTVLDWPEPDLAQLIFHELAHQVLYVRDDTAFNEAFATAVADVGVRRWLVGRVTEPERQALRLRRRQEGRFLHQALSTRDRLADLYRQDLPAASMRVRKAALIGELRDWHDGHSEPGDPYSGWFDNPVNNARFVLLATYLDLVPDFQHWLARVDNDLPAFYARMRELEPLTPAERRQRLSAR